METKVVQVDPGSPRRQEEEPARNQAESPVPPTPLWLIPLDLWGPPARTGETPAPAQPVADKEVAILSADDVILARQSARETARELGFSAMDQTRIATATAELSRNVYQYAGQGTVTIHPITLEDARGLEIVFADRGPGIPNLEQALEDGFSAANHRGQGLPGSRRLVDEFAVDSQAGVGTRITIRKWLTKKNNSPPPAPSRDFLSF
ncbi:MAG: anti-sigma regulatory factor [Syntrophobacterales bacterium]|jgi:serine/threonine-protein kinase RsbT|nr:anti-sigma regulatory factor [Syntrophobacterales bacterium]